MASDPPRAGEPRTRAPWGAVGMLAAAMAVEGFVSRRPLDFTDYVALSWYHSREAAGGPDGRAAILCLGDSLVKTGLLPSVLERRLGRSAYNLAVLGAQAPTSFFLLRRALESGARPEAIVVDFHPDVLVASPRSSAPYWTDLTDLRDELDLTWSALDPTLTAIVGWARPLPSYRGRDAIREAIRAALLGIGPPSRANRLEFDRRLRLDRGAAVVPGRKKAPGASAFGPPKKARWAPRPVHVAYVRRLLALAESRGIPVFWVITPTTPAWQAHREQIGADGPYERFVRSMQVRFPNVVVIDGRHAGYDASVFFDATHLDGRGATVLTVAVADVLSDRLGARREGPRWVALAPYRDPTPEPYPPVPRLATPLVPSGRR